MPVRTTDHIIRLHFPIDNNLIESHRILCRILRNLHEINEKGDYESYLLAQKSKEFFNKIIILALDIENNRLNKNILLQYYERNGIPIDLECDSKKKLCGDDVDNLIIVCELDDKMSFFYAFDKRITGEGCSQMTSAPEARHLII